MMLDLHPEVPQTHLMARGVPRRTLGLFRSYDPRKCCSQFLLTRHNDDGEEEKKPVKAIKQIEWLMRCIDDPFHDPYLMYLSDYKNGDIARCVAASVFSNALIKHTNLKRDRPLWLRLNQGYVQQVPLEGDSRPSLLILDNVFIDSTAAKVEKLRDILSNYDDTPVLVIVSTPGNPLALSEQFNLAATYGVLLRDNRVMTKEEEV